MKKIVVFLCGLLLLNSFNVFSSIDSLLHLAQTAKHDTLTCMFYLECGDFYELSNPDSADYYYIKAEKIAQAHLQNKSKLSKAEILAYINLLSRVLRYRAVLYINHNIFSKPIEMLLNHSLAYARISKNLKAQASCYINLGVYYFQKSLYDQALICQIEALKIAEAINDNNAIANIHLNLANIYTIQKEYKKAIEAFQKSMQYFEKEKEYYHAAKIYNNLAILYKDQKNYQLSKDYYKKALSIFEKHGDSPSLAYTLVNLGILLVEQKQYNEALTYYERGLKIHQTLKDTNGIIITLVNSSDCYIKFYQETKNHKWLLKALGNCETAYRLNERMGSLNSKNGAAMKLMEIYRLLKQYDKAIEYSIIYVQTRDSLFSEEKSKAIAEAEALYQTEKQQRLIEKLHHEKQLNLKTIEAQQAENKRQKTTIYAAISVSVLLVMLLSVVAYFLRINQIHNRQLTIKNYQISKQKEEIAAQRDLLLHQKIQIEAYHKALKDSIYYAKNIQKAVIPGEAFVKNILHSCFVLFIPRDIVSGDFYWIQEQSNIIYLVVADCTGHGVPGALMSMMAVSFLNEQFHKNRLNDTAEVLETLRAHLIQSFHLNEQPGKMKDGLDMIFVTFNKKTNQLSFSAANNPLYIVRKNDDVKLELIELVPDKMPVGFHPNIRPFKKEQITLRAGDVLYFTTDGFGDQFGGEQGKKFLRKRLKNTLLQISQENIDIQKEKLIQTLNIWQTSTPEPYPQTDDITIIGWRI